MIQVPYIPETAPFTAEQRAWLNGFLAGLYAHEPGQKAAPRPESNGSLAGSGTPLLVLFGSQSGTAEGLAKQVAQEAQQRGFVPKLLPLNDYEQANLAAGGTAVIISSTWGDGDPPDNATQFWSWISSDSVPRLEQLSFAVLGLGDRNYSEFCGASKKFDLRLEALGAKRLINRGECDVDYETPAKKWIDGLWEKLKAAGTPPDAPPAIVNGSNGHPSKNGAVHANSAQFSRTNPFPARLLRNVLLNKPGSCKEVRHFEIGLEGSGLTYEVGDALGVMPANCPELVREVIAALRADADETVTVGSSAIPLREALARHFDITKPSRELLEVVAKASPGCDLASLLVEGREVELKKWLWGRDIIDLLRLLSTPFTPAELAPLLKPLAPRLYSISSSPKAHPAEVHLTIGAVRYSCHARSRKGVASTFLADRIDGEDRVKVFVQVSNGFRLPTSGDTPIIMIGPGTGIAPFRAFLEDRQAVGATGKNWLFFGDQTRAGDFLYEDQLTAWERDRFLHRLDLAFSRDQPEKIYVQNRMIENGPEIWSWLESGAHLYVCGDASRMARDVDAALHQIIETAGGKSGDQAREYVAKLKSARRYQRDVY